MKRITTNTARAHPLLADACRCLTAGGMRCMTCWRWLRHRDTVMQLREAWRAAR